MRFFIVLLCFIGTNIHAETYHHKLGVLLGSGTMATQLKTESDYTSLLLGLKYEYHFNNAYAIQLAVNTGSDLCFITCAETNSLEFSSNQISILRNVSISQNWTLLGRIGLNKYSITYPYNDYLPDEPKIEMSGTGLVIAAGIGYTINKRLSVGGEFQTAAMDKNRLNTLTVNFGVAF